MKPTVLIALVAAAIAGFVLAWSCKPSDPEIALSRAREKALRIQIDSLEALESLRIDERDRLATLRTSDSLAFVRALAAARRPEAPLPRPDTLTLDELAEHADTLIQVRPPEWIDRPLVLVQLDSQVSESRQGYPYRAARLWMEYATSAVERVPLLEEKVARLNVALDEAERLQTTLFDQTEALLAHLGTEKEISRLRGLQVDEFRLQSDYWQRRYRRTWVWKATTGVLAAAVVVVSVTNP